MITAEKLQASYNALYASMRNYIWDMSTVVALADLEVETYQRFPDTACVDQKLDILKKSVLSTDAYKEDEGLKETFAEFKNILDEDGTIYASLQTFNEVVTDEYEGYEAERI